jgi:LacI family transcriptional regulator
LLHVDLVTVTIRDVARAAGVGQATAARALHGYGSVSAGTTSKVLQAANDLGYRSNPIAQALRSGQTRSIGFVSGNIENPFFATVARHLGDTLERSRYTLLVASSDESLDRERSIVTALRANMVSGLVVAPTASGDGSHLAEALESGMPIVLVDRIVTGLDVDSVTVDNLSAAQRAVRHLIEAGHRDIALLTDSTPITSTIDRTEGYRQALLDAGYAVDPHRIVSVAPTRESAYEAALHLLKSAIPPTAIFAADNFMTEGALRAIRDLDIRVPDSLSLVGFDDTELATFVTPATTVVAQPVPHVGRRAAELILRRIERPSAPVKMVSLPATLVLRQSVGPPPARTPQL